MKLVVIIMTTCLLQVSASSFAQKLTFSKQGASLSEIFKAIKLQTGYNVLYSPDQIDAGRKLNVNFKNSDLTEVLKSILDTPGQEYSIVDKNILIKEKEPSFLDKIASVISNDRRNLIDITGRVVDEKGAPLPGATVKVKDGKGAAMTDAQGRFLIENVKDDAVLVISYTGYVTKELPAKQNMGSITLLLSENPLDQVQIIAYGTQTKRLSVGNVTMITAKEIEQQPVQNPLFALQGRVPGLVVTQSTGLANGAFKVRIQGQNSIGRGSDPLIVVDGVPLAFELLGSNMDSFDPLNGGSPLNPVNSPINFINPSDIESISILKDADATAIYGSRAANGALLITTKKGKPGKIKIDVGVQQGWGRVGHEVEMLNTRQYLEMRYEGIKNDGLNINDFPNYDLRVWDTTRYTNWQKELIGGTAQYSNINASVSGGTEYVQYLVGATFNKSGTVFPGDFASKTGNLHFNLNTSSANQRFKFSLTGSYAVNGNGVPGTDLTKAALFLAPNAPPLYNEDGTLNWAPNASGSSTFDNPLTETAYRAYEHAVKSLNSNAQVGYVILPGLTVKGSFGYNNIQGNSFLSTSAERYPPEDRTSDQRYSSFNNLGSFSWIAEPQLTYAKLIGKIAIDALAGGTFQKNKAEQNFTQAYGFTSDLLVKSIRSATNVRAGYDNTIYQYSAVFGRLNATYDQKYVINLNIRRDGSSRFGENNLFHNFWSAGAGWIFTEEKIIGNVLPFLSFGKLRASYGTTGSDQIGNYQYLNNYYTPQSRLPYQNSAVLASSGLNNPNLQWEETRKMQSGLDLGAFKGRVLLNLTYARNRSSNQLIQYLLPSVTGSYSLLQNFPATVQNTSWEFSLVTNTVKTKDFAWTINANLTIPRNKLIAFPGIEESSYAKGLDGVIIGQPLGARPYARFLGIDPNSGYYSIANENNQPVGLSQDADRNILISTQPRFYGGIGNTLNYKGFSLDLLFQFVRQKGPRELFFWNGSDNLPGAFVTQYSNQPVTVLNRWQKPGDNNLIQRFATGGILPVTETDAWFSYDASYIRLKNVSLSWQIPEKWLKSARIQNAGIYFRGQNLATITNYTGLDPETQNSTTLPPLQMWTVGFTVGL
ncbi:SusC/RagA family TonB-linked outer membrane protein [Pedobacter africanus]|nr:SusC/RagA family TonB-linked outer membrane protein [Pedobacter africanus]